MADVLYHYTCSYLLPSIMKARYLTLTRSNFSLDNMRLFPVVWLTDSPMPDIMGLLFDPNIPDDLNKTRIRFTIRKKKYMKQWDEWSDSKGMDKQLKQALIASASAENTYMSWYVSEQIIPINDIITIENLATGKVLYQKE